MPFYRRHPLAMVFLRLAVSIAGGLWVMLGTHDPDFSQSHITLMAFLAGLVAAWIASYVTVWICEGWRVARDTPFLEL